MEKPTIIIANWDAVFESSESRKLKRMSYFQAPTGVDSAGYLELMTEHGEGGILALGVFQALCQITATWTKDRRGRFEKSKGNPMSVRQIAALIRMPEDVVSRSVQLLASKEVGWLILEISQQSPADLPAISHESPTDLPPESQSNPETPRIDKIRGDKIKGEESTEDESVNAEGCCTFVPDPLPQPEPTPIISGSDPMSSQQAIIDRVKRGLRGVNPEWLPHFTQMEMIDLSANLSLWAEIPKHYWLLMRWWYSRKRPALVRQKPNEKHYPFAERASLLKDTTRCLDAIADKWNQAGKPALEPRQKKQGDPKPESEDANTAEPDPLDQLSPEDFQSLRKKVESGPLSEIDKAMMNSENKALAMEHVRMLMRETLTETQAV